MRIYATCKKKEELNSVQISVDDNSTCQHTYRQTNTKSAEIHNTISINSSVLVEITYQVQAVHKSNGNFLFTVLEEIHYFIQ